MLIEFKLGERITRTQYLIDKELGIHYVPSEYYKFIEQDIREDGLEDRLSYLARLTYMEQFENRRDDTEITIPDYLTAIARTRREAREGLLDIPFEDVTLGFLIEQALKVREVRLERER